ETLQVGNVGLLDLIWSIAESTSADDCASPVDVPWLSTDPSGGTTVPDASQDVDVDIDAAGLVGGVYEAALCVTTNDPDQPMVAVPVTLTVLGAVADVSPASFAFEVFEGGSADDTLNIGNVGTVDLTWTISTTETALHTATAGTHNPALDEPLAVPTFTVNSLPNGGSVVSFEVPGGV